MEKLNLICYINSAGFNVNYLNIEDTIVSIDKNVNTKYKFYITTDSETHKEQIEKIFLKNNLVEKLLNIKVSNDSWAKCFNSFFDENKSLTDYILYSHDDLKVRTFDFFNITLNEISGYEDQIGWIGFTSDSYYRLNNLAVPQSAREVFCEDRSNWPYVFEVHKMKNGFSLDKIDMPKRTCKVPGIFPHFNLIKTSNLEKIGLCPEWGKYTLLIDEHWSLMTLIKNLWTIWIPNIYYDHPLRYEERIIKDLQNQNETINNFINFWGIRPAGLSKQEVENFCNRYPNTNISFFNDKKTYEYCYLKNN